MLKQFQNKTVVDPGYLICNPPRRPGPLILDPLQMTLTREGQINCIGGRAVALCVALVEGKVEATDKYDVIKAAWPNSCVEAANLSVQLSALRKALAINSDGTAWIVTVPRQGYRLDADDDVKVIRDYVPPF